MKHDDPEIMLMVANVRQSLPNLNKEELEFLCNFLLDSLLRKSAQMEEVTLMLEEISSAIE